MTTTTTEHEVTRRKWQRPASRHTSFADDLGDSLTKQIDRTLHVQFPNPKYQRDPIAFFREILGVEPWSRQRDILEAVRDHDRVAVASGHKVSKSHSAAGLACWYYCSFPDARVVMTSTTSRQVDQILWRELRMLRARSGRCVACKAEDPEGRRIKRPCPHSTLIEGEQGELARTGLKAPDFREIVGFTAKEAEAVAGISGLNLLYIVDEGSGVDDLIYEAIDGNRAGGAKIVIFSQGTRNTGEFYEAFTSKQRFYKTMRISSEETPNYQQQRMVIPGLASYEWVEEKKLEWGEDSPLYRIRVKGEHALHDELKIFSVHAIAAAEARWPETPDAGRLYIGLDPAGDSGIGDETCYAVRRGYKLLALRVQRGLSVESHLMQLLLIIREYGLPNETPVVVVDRDGSIGAQVNGTLRAHLDQHPNAYELVSMRGSDKAVRRPDLYDRARDELTGNLDTWIRGGGAIVEDAKLAKELHSMEWKLHINGRLKVIAKDKLRVLLGRSPDRYDATALSAWEPLSLTADLSASERAATHLPVEAARPASVTFDPYSAQRAFRT